MSAQIIDVTNLRDPTCREDFWIEKLNSCLPLGTKQIKKKRMGLVNLKGTDCNN